jgi:hypothetical protein
VTAIGALLAPTNTPGKLTLTGDKLTTGATPTPLIATLCGLPDALSEIFNVDDRLPVLVGVKITLIVQLALAAMDAGQVLLCEKSPELPVEILMLVTDSVAFPVFVSVTTCALLPMPTIWLPKLRLVGDRLTAAWADRNVEDANTTHTPTHRRGVSILGIVLHQTKSGGCSASICRRYCALARSLKSRKKKVGEPEVLNCADFCIIDVATMVTLDEAKLHPTAGAPRLPPRSRVRR